MSILKNLKSYIVPVVIGVICGAILFSLTNPEGGYPWLAWLIMIPVILGLYRYKTAPATVMWLVYGIAHSWVSLSWLGNFLYFVFDMPLWLVCVLMFSLFVFDAIPYAFTAYVVVRWKILRRPGGILFFAALLAVLVELLPSPFPRDLSMSFYQTPILTQIADVGGGHFIHFVIIFVNALVAQAIIMFYGQRRLVKKPLIIAGVTLLAVIAYGTFRLAQFHSRYHSAEPDELLSVGFIQTNIMGSDLTPRYGEFYPEDHKYNDLLTSIELTRDIQRTKIPVDLIVWPEIPRVIPYGVDESFTGAINRIIKGTNAFFHFTDIYPYSGDSELNYYVGWNALLQVSPDLEFSVPYKKVNLVPFSEFLPFEHTFPILREWFPTINQLEHGKEGVMLSLGDKMRLVPFICYDAIFPSYVRKLVQEKGGNVMFSLDNDVDFGPTHASRMHFSAMIYRAIEHRMPFLRISNAGPSMLVQSSGAIMRESVIDIYQRGSRVVRFLPGDESSTLYLRGGRWLNWILLVFAFILIIQRPCELSS